ncbi:MAG: biotin--[acetyl-CoA-carboxylase] ligase [Planctomycetota bacterium]
MDTSHTPLSAPDLLAGGPLRRLGRRVFVLETVDSTNAFLLARAGAEGDAVRAGLDGALASAEYQTAGRGRLGRRWHAPRGSSILLSTLLIEPADSPLLERITVLAAVAACETVEAAASVGVAVRWPNDLVCSARKLGGVLAEASPLAGQRASARGPRRRRTERSSPDTVAAQGGLLTAVVIGIGLNCLQQRGHFPPELADRATSLELESARPVSRRAVAAALVAHLDRRLAELGQPGGWPRLLAAWRGRCDDMGARVTLEHDGRTLSGTAVEVTDSGHLVVELDAGGRRHFAPTTTTRLW